MTGPPAGRRPPRFVLFDYGNTLVPYGRREAGILDRVVAETAAGWLPVEAGDFVPAVGRVKEALIRGTRETGREVTNAAFATALAASAGAASVPDGLEEALEDRVGASLVATLRLPPAVLPVLDALAGRFRLGLVSNYYLARPIHRTLEAFGIAGRLEASVVSAEVGWVKPRREAFQAVLDRLGADPADCVFVGDNLHADVGGAAALGMATVHTREWLDGALPLDAADAANGARPDFVIHRLEELPPILDGAGRR